MAGGTLTTVDNILKEYYLGPVQEQLNNEVLLVQRLEARSEDLVGRVAIVPLHTGRSGGIGAVCCSSIRLVLKNRTEAKLCRTKNREAIPGTTVHNLRWICFHFTNIFDEI